MWQSKQQKIDPYLYYNENNHYNGWIELLQSNLVPLVFLHMVYDLNHHTCHIEYKRADMSHLISMYDFKQILSVITFYNWQ